MDIPFLKYGACFVLQDDECDGDRSVKPAYTQHLPANGKVMLIADTGNITRTDGLLLVSLCVFLSQWVY